MIHIYNYYNITYYTFNFSPIYIFFISVKRRQSVRTAGDAPPNSALTPQHFTKYSLEGKKIKNKRFTTNTINH